MVSSNISSNPRSLYHTKNVKKKLRLQGINFPPSALQTRVEPIQVAKHSATENEIISPYAPDANGTRITVENILQPAHIPDLDPASKSLQAADNKDDNVDIVPDSEPPRAGLDSSERQPSQLAPIAIAVIPEVENETGKDLLRERISPPAQLPLVSEDETDDIPLAALVSKSRNTRRAVYTEDSDSASDRSTNSNDNVQKVYLYVSVPSRLTFFGIWRFNRCLLQRNGR
jgi:hypothetical protein